MSDTGQAVASSILPAAGAGWFARHRYWFAAAVLLVVLPHIPGFDGGFGRSLLSQMGIAAVFALSYNLLLGHTGLLSFGHAVYFGLGGYTAIHFMQLVNAGLPVPIVLVPLVGGLGGLCFAALFGSVTTKKGGTIFALITLGIGELVFAASFLLHGFFGGEEGITANRTRALPLFGLKFGPQIQVYYLIAFWAFVSAALLYAFTRTPVGRLCNAVRDNHERAEFVGYNPRYVRLVAFIVAGFFAGVAGGLHAVNYEIVAADSVSMLRSGAVLIMTYIGGIGHFIGPIIGAVVLTWLQVNLSDYTYAWLLYLGLFFMAIILFAPGGLAGLLLMHVPILRTRAFLRVLGAYAVAAVPALVAVVGASVLIEMSYQLATHPELGTGIRLYWTDLDAGTPWPWIGATALFAAGALLFRLTWPLVARAWQQALEGVTRRAQEGTNA